MSGSIDDAFYTPDKNPSTVSAPLKIQDQQAVISKQDTLFSKGIKLKFDKGWTGGAVTVTLVPEGETITNIQDNATGASWAHDTGSNTWSFVVGADVVGRALESGKNVSIGYTVFWGSGRHDPEIRVTPVE